MMLPSVRAAQMYINGEEGGLAAVVSSTLGRAALIGAGIAVIGGERDPVRLAKHAIGGAVAIEVFVLWYTNRPETLDSAETALTKTAYQSPM